MATAAFTKADEHKVELVPNAPTDVVVLPDARSFARDEVEPGLDAPTDYVVLPGGSAFITDGTGRGLWH